MTKKTRFEVQYTKTPKPRSTPSEPNQIIKLVNTCGIWIGILIFCGLLTLIPYAAYSSHNQDKQNQIDSVATEEARESERRAHWSAYSTDKFNTLNQITLTLEHSTETTTSANGCLRETIIVDQALRNPPLTVRCETITATLTNNSPYSVVIDSYGHTHPGSSRARTSTVTLASAYCDHALNDQYTAPTEYDGYVHHYGIVGPGRSVTLTCLVGMYPQEIKPNSIPVEKQCIGIVDVYTNDFFYLYENQSLNTVTENIPTLHGYNDSTDRRYKICRSF